MQIQHLLTFSVLLAGPALGLPLLETLRANGFNKYAELLQGSPVLSAGPGLIVFVPTDAALARNGNISVARRKASPEELAALGNLYNAASGAYRRNPTLTASSSATSPQQTGANRRGLESRQTSPLTSNTVYETLVDDPAFVKLFPGVNQTLVQKNVASSPWPVLFSGLGTTSKVTGDDIPYDNGVIRPIAEVLTLPRNASETLPYLNANKFLAALDKAGLLTDVDTRSAVTILAPSDAAFEAGTSNLSEAQLVTALKQHIVVGSLGYTPLLRDGTTFSTLAGGTVTVSVQGDVVTFNGVKLVAGDALTINGVVHSIGKLLPAQQGTGSPTTTGTANTTLPSAIATAAASKLKSLSCRDFALALVGVAVAAGYGTLV